MDKHAWLPLALLASACSTTSQPTADTMIDAQTQGDAALASDALGADASNVEPGVYRLRGITLPGDDSDLNPLAAIVGNADIIGLGEAVHSAGGIYQAKARVVRWLVEHHGVRVVGFEANWQPTLAIDAALANCDADFRELLREHMGPERSYASEEIAELAEYICAWNTSHPRDRVHLIGLDVRQPWLDSLALRTFLSESDAHGTSAVREDLRACVPRDATTYTAYIALFQNGAQHTIANHARCISALDAIDALFARNAATWSQSSSAKDVEIARLHARSLRAVENQVSLYPGNVTGVQGASLHASMQARATGLMEMVRDLIPALFGPSRSVLWFANLHVQYDLPAATGPSEAGAMDTGSLLHAEFADRYRALAVVARAAIVSESGQPRTLATSDDAVETLLIRALGQGPWLVDLQETTRFLPNRPYELGFFLQVPAAQFHGLVVLDASAAAALLPR